MARSFTYRHFTNEKGQPLINVKVEAYDATDDSLQETAYTDSSGDAAFTALPDANDVYLKFTWTNKVHCYYPNSGLA